MIVPSRFYVRKILKLVSKYLFIDVDFIRLPFGFVGVALRSLQLQIMRYEYILLNFEILMQYNHAYSAIMDTTIVLWKIKCLNIKTLMRWSGHYESHSLYFNYPAQNKRIPHFPHHKKNIYRAINHNWQFNKFIDVHTR